MSTEISRINKSHHKYTGFCLLSKTYVFVEKVKLMQKHIEQLHIYIYIYIYIYMCVCDKVTKKMWSGAE